MTREHVSDGLGTRRRQSLRLPEFDYAAAGAYFVTICTKGRVCVLGDVVDGEVRLSDFGRLVNSDWFGLAESLSSCSIGCVGRYAEPCARDRDVGG